MSPDRRVEKDQELVVGKSVAFGLLDVGREVVGPQDRAWNHFACR